MNKMYFLRSMLFIFLGTLTQVYAQYPAGSPAAQGGKLKVIGTQLSTECGDPIQLKGMSAHGIQWFPTCYTASSLDALTNNWKISILRLAMYNSTAENGWDSDTAKWNHFIDNLVDECGKRGIYAIIDWHIAAQGDPNSDIANAKNFWTRMSKVHGSKKHVLYEICNEPQVGMSTITQYANQIIPLIRANDPKAVIIIGTPSYSSLPRTDLPPTPVGANLMYTLHFYAGNGAHMDYQNNLTAALNKGIPVFVTEWGTTGSDGNAGYNQSNSDSWINLMDQKKISWCNWSFSDKAEGSAALNANSCSSQSWTSLTTSGTYVKGKMSSNVTSKACTLNVPPPTVTLTLPLKDTTVILQQGTTITLGASVTGGTGTISKVDFVTATTLIGSATTAPFKYTWTPTAAGVYVIKARATTSGGIQGISSTINVYVGVPQTPFKGTAWAVPGKIEAENFNVGGNNNAYYDNTLGNSGTATYRTGEDVDIENPAGVSNGYTLGYTMKGEWLNYTIKVANSGVYSLAANVASNVAGNSMHFEIDGKSISGPIAVNSTGGWSTFSNVTVPKVNLIAGEHILKMVFDSDNINIDYFNFTVVSITGLFSSDNQYETVESLYPNPSNGAFNVKVNEGIQSLSVSNMFGEVVETRSNIGEGQTIQIGSNLEAGTYILNLQTIHGKMEMFKLSKAK